MHLCEVKYQKLQMKSFAGTSEKKPQDLQNSRIQPIPQQRKRAAGVSTCIKLSTAQQ